MSQLEATDGMTLTVSPCGFRTGWGASAAEMASRCGATCPNSRSPAGVSSYPRTAVEEPVAQQLLQAAHLVAQRADGEVEGGCRPGEVPRPRGGEEPGKHMEGDLAHLEFCSTRT